MKKLVISLIYQHPLSVVSIEDRHIELININIPLGRNKMISLYRLSPNRESRTTIDTLLEMGVLTIKLVRYSQYLWKHKINTIIPYVYEEARAYYKKEAKKAEEISELIQKQLAKDRIEIKYNPNNYIGRNKKKKLINLDEIGVE